MLLRRLRDLRWLAPVVGLLVAGLFLARRHLLPDGGGAGVPADAPRVSVEEAGDRVGEAATVCGAVAEATYLPAVEGRPTFLNFGGRHPDQAFTAVVWGRDRGAFDLAPERAYRNAYLCVTGVVERHEGTPQIQVRSPHQVRTERPPRSTPRSGRRGP